MAKWNFLNHIVHLQGLRNHILAYHLFTIPWNIDEVQVTRIGKAIFRPLYDSRDENKNSKTLLHIYKTYSSISYSIICLLLEFKWQSLYDRKRHFSTLIWPQEVKLKFQIPSAHIQDMPIYICEYQLSTSENVHVVQVTNFTVTQLKGNNLYILILLKLIALIYEIDSFQQV